MRHEEGPRTRGANSNIVRTGHGNDSRWELTTEDLKTAGALAFQTNNTVRLCDSVRCVDVVPDVEFAELIANGEDPGVSWLQVRSSVTFPGRVAYVYMAGPAEVAA